MECTICCVELNKTTRKSVICFNCNEYACRECYKKYLTESVGQPNCLFCKKIFTEDFVQNNLSNRWFNDEYNIHRMNTNWNFEKARFTEFMEDARKQSFILKLTDERTPMNIHYKNEIQTIKNQHTNEIAAIDKKFNTQIKTINAHFLPLIQALDNQIEELQHQFAVKSENEPKKIFTLPCIYPNCKGILNHIYHCTLCEQWACKDCLEPIKQRNDPEHICDPNILANVIDIRNNTKSCPKCQTSIYKISGCDQMWCTQCNTFFSWKTGKISNNGFHHNPHYFEWLNRQGTANRNVINQENQECNVFALRPRIEKRFIKSKYIQSIKKYLLEIDGIYRKCIEVREHENLQYINIYERNHRDIIILFLNNRISEDETKQKLYGLLRNRMFGEEITQICQVIEMTFMNICNQMMEPNIPDTQFPEFIKNGIEILNFTKDSIKRIMKRYHTTKCTSFVSFLQDKIDLFQTFKFT